MKGKQGFASMDPARAREIAVMGGKAVQAKGTGHRWNTEEGVNAGRKGGRMSAERRKLRSVQL